MRCLNEMNITILQHNLSNPGGVICSTLAGPVAVPYSAGDPTSWGKTI